MTFVPRKPGGKNQPSAYGKALGLLSRREHSARELQHKLVTKGYERDDAAEALDRLKSQSFQDDSRFGETLIRARVAQGYGPRRLQAELRGHGFSDSETKRLLEASETDWLELARRIFRRRYAGKTVADRAEQAKRAGFLLRRGFDAATVRTITHADDVDDSSDEFD